MHNIFQPENDNFLLQRGDFFFYPSRTPDVFTPFD